MLSMFKVKNKITGTRWVLMFLLLTLDIFSAKFNVLNYIYPARSTCSELRMKTPIAECCTEYVQR